MKVLLFRTTADLIDSESRAILRKDFIEPHEKEYPFEEGREDNFRSLFSEGFKDIDLSQYENIVRVEVECLWDETSITPGSQVIEGKNAPFLFTLNGVASEFSDNGFFSKGGGVSSLSLRPANPVDIGEIVESKVKFRVLICAK
ncbi:hypothetical protein [Leptospira santarosai]|uniref:hypothetical protein n=1 Tax=Leptospira santarosai TaxID=28183 RepID=UPI0002BDDAA4|nr:hypothetical protein [Leptospira santarosai]EMO12474.1 hypothetical protein LEP1GSC165_0032 [Leptospira santarosai str. CBC523]MDI7183587.1 hypothetical protein [Leptospira santarosai]